MFNVKQLKMSEFIKYIWQLKISTWNATIQVLSLRPCIQRDVVITDLLSQKFINIKKMYNT